MEMWKDIPGYEGKYQVSTQGNVRSLNRTFMNECGITVTRKGVVLVQRLNRDGYCRVTLHKNRTLWTAPVHRLVAEAFVPNEQGKREVNHKDGNKQNNSADNLEWLTPKENQRHAMQNGLREKALQYSRDNRKKVIATEIATGKVTHFDSVHAAEKVFGSHVTNVLSGKRNTTRGHTFRFAGGGDA